MLSVETWKSIFDWATVGLAALTFVALAGAVITGDVLNKRQEIELAQLKKESGEASENAGQANERARSLETANLTLRGQVATLETNAAKQQERAAIAEKSLLELQEKIKPRHLTQDQQIKIASRLKGEVKGQVEIQCQVGDPEAHMFALEILKLFKDNGWEASLNDRILIMGSTPMGIQLLVHTDKSDIPPGVKMEGEVPRRANSIFMAFQDAKLEIEPLFDFSVAKDTVVVRVGHKP